MSNLARPLPTLPSLAESLSVRGALMAPARAGIGPPEPGWIAFETLGAERSAARDALLAMEAERCAGLDAKGQTAFLIGDAAHYLLSVLAPLYLAERQVPDLSAQNLAVRTQAVPWQHGGRSGTYQALSLRFHGPRFWTDRQGRLPDGGRALLGEDELRAFLAQQLEHLFLPLILSLKAATGLSPGAQWRLVADALAGAFLQTGRALGEEARARAEALALIRDRHSRLYNRQTDFVDIEIDNPAESGQPIARQSYRARGGCCRYYTADDGQLCATCVLHKPEERDERLREHLLRHRG